MNIQDKIPAQSIESEQAILGSILMQNESLYEIENIMPEHFYKDIHRIIFRAILDMNDKSVAVDVITLSERLKKDKKLDDIGGTFYLMQLTEIVPSSAQIKMYANIVDEKYQLRKAQDSIYQIQKMIDDNEDPATIYEKMGSCAIQDAGDKKIYTLAEVLQETIEAIDDRASGKVCGLTTGIYGLDNYLTLDQQDLIVIGGYSSQGKTSLAVQLALHLTESLKQQTLLFELEMDRKRLAARLVCMYSQINSDKFWHARLDKVEQEKAGIAFGAIQNAPLLIDDSAGVSLHYIKSHVKRSIQKHDLKAVIVDYLQLMDLGKTDSKEEGISNTTCGLKCLAKELNIPIILLSQFRRHEGTRFNKKPSMSDLKGSGAIEQDADKVLLPWLPNLRKEENELNGEERYKAKIIIEKNREGAIGEVDLKFNNSYAKFE